MKTSSIIPSKLENFFKDKDIVWDFKNNHCLFPLYLFRKFHSKYCDQEEIIKEESGYYNRTSVYCEYKTASLPKDYSSWFIATTRFSAVNFYFQIGEPGFIPFNDGKEHSKGLISYINIKVSCSDKLSVHLNAGMDSKFNVLFLNNKIAEEIVEELKSNGLSI